MRILFVTHRIPYPAKDGGLVATLALLEQLRAEGVQIKLLCLNASRDQNDLSQVPSYFFEELELEYVNIDTHLKPLPALWHLLSNRSYNISRFHHPDFDKLVFKYASSGNYDLVHFENLFSTKALHALWKKVKIPMVIRMHNVEHLIWKDLAAKSRNPLKKFYLNTLSRQLKRYETDTLQKADAIVPIAPGDANIFSQLGITSPMHLATHGLREKDFSPALPPVNPESVFHLASMDWMPNVEAMEWFVKDIWPLVLKEKSTATFHMAGKNMPAHLLAMKEKQVFVQGSVDDVKGFCAQHHILVVPLKSGSGIRIKILEGMAMAKPMVVTSKALEGISAENGRHLLVADDEAGIAKALVSLMNDPGKALELGKAAQELAMEKYSLRNITRSLLDFYSGLKRR